jgi:hypothetical protein
MKTYYSIVYLSTNPQIEEKFSIGLICVSPTDVYYRFSQQKFDLVSKLLSKNGK